MYLIIMYKYLKESCLVNVINKILLLLVLILATIGDMIFCLKLIKLNLMKLKHSNHNKHELFCRMWIFYGCQNYENAIQILKVFISSV